MGTKKFSVILMAYAHLEFLSTINDFECAFNSKCKIKSVNWNWLRFSAYNTSTSKEILHCDSSCK